MQTNRHKLCGSYFKKNLENNLRLKTKKSENIHNGVHNDINLRQ